MNHTINVNLDAVLSVSTLSHLSGLDLQMYALPFLQVTGYSKQVPHLGISFWPEHAHKAFTGFSADYR